jgi:uncharacterized membrane protein
MSEQGPRNASAVAQAETTQDERTMAVLAHALQVVGGWIAPLVIFIVKRQSRFVSFHSLQVLFLHLVYVVVWGCFMAFFVAGVFLAFLHIHGSSNNPPPPAIFVLFPLLWFGFMGMWVFTVVVAVVYAIKAGRGEWAEYPVLGAWARRVLKIGPGGAPMT